MLGLVAFNQIVVGGITQYIFYLMHKEFHNTTTTSIKVVPSVFRVLLELTVFVIIEEVLFFYFHWALHRSRCCVNPFLFKQTTWGNREFRVIHVFCIHKHSSRYNEVCKQVSISLISTFVIPYYIEKERMNIVLHLKCSRFLYGNIHKIHHEWTATVALGRIFKLAFNNIKLW